MTTATKARRTRKPENSVEIRVRLNARTKAKAEKLFRRHGLSTGDGMRRLIDNIITEDDPWLACKMSSHIPNAETAKAIEEGLAEKSNPMTPEEFRKFLEES